MKVLALMVGVTALLITANTVHAEVPWRASFAAAQAEAVQAKKLLFVEFTLPG